MNDHTHLASLPCAAFASDSFLPGPVGLQQSLRQPMWSSEGYPVFSGYKKMERNQLDSDQAISFRLTCFL